MRIPRKSCRPTKESIRLHWGQTESGKKDPYDWKTKPDREFYHYMSSSFFAIQMRLEAIVQMAASSKEPALHKLILAEKTEAERELDLCGEILQLTGLGECKN